MMCIRPIIPLLMALAVLGAGGCATTTASTPASSGPPIRAIGNTVLVDQLPEPDAVAGAQALGPNDVIQVDVFGVPQLGRTVEVDAGGQISLPLIGAVAAGGRTQRDLEQAIASAYAQDYLQSPQVSVLVTQSAGQRVTVDGEVNRAGIYPTTAGSSLIQVIAQAGNFNAVANPRQVLVFRRHGDKRYVASFDVAAARKGQAADPPIFGGDVVVVPDSAAKLAREDLRDILGMAGKLGSLAVLGI